MDSGVGAFPERRLCWRVAGDCCRYARERMCGIERKSVSDIAFDLKASI
jgi:hypothetical protein